MSDDTNLVPAPKLDPGAIQKVLLYGDLSPLTAEARNTYYMDICRLVGLNHLTKPFDFLELNRKLVLYANKGCAEQLRAIHKIGLTIVSREKIDDIYVVTANAINPDGRTDSATGAVSIAGLRGEGLANAMMKAETKAKRRVTLSICGLNMLDETEVDTIEDAKRTRGDQTNNDSSGRESVKYEIPTRSKLGLEINAERKRLQWDADALNDFIFECFGKPSHAMTENDMVLLIQTLKTK